MPTIVLFMTWALAVAFQVAAWPRLFRSRGWETGALALVLLLAGVHQIYFSTLAEDAYITFRYSAQLAAGNGPVFNIGERVEGYSNFLLMVLLAAPLSIADVDIVLLARLLGGVSTLVALVLVHLLVRRITGSGAAGVLAATVTAAVGSVAAYGLSGMETPLFVALVLACLLAILADRPVVGGLLIALATMTRPDGAVIAAVILVRYLFTASNPRSRGRSIALYLGAAASIGVPWTVWRVLYYGHFLPNPVAAKSGMDPGWQLASGWLYLVGFVVAVQALLLLVPVAVHLTVRRAGRIDGPERDAVLLLFSTAAVYTAFFVVSGGDWMPAWRFFVPVVPLVTAGVVAACWLAWPPAAPAPGRRAPLLVVGLTLLLLASSVTDPAMRPAVDDWRRQVAELAEIGAWLDRTLPPGTVVSTFANGALSYRAGLDLVVVDQLGLTDEHIARDGRRQATGIVGHGAHDYDYIVRERRPEVVVTTGGGFQRTPSCAVADVWRGEYVARAFQVAGQELWVTLLLRSDVESRLAEAFGRDVGYDLVPCPPAPTSAAGSGT